MPIKAYVGQMRSGKTYEVVSHVILNGLRDGRRVVSNIAGLDYDAMCQMLIAEGVPEEKIGVLVPVTHKDVEKPLFWRTDEDSQAGVETFLQPGDLLALDEIWRFFEKRGRINPRAMNFFRMHGHMPHPETGYICEIALISQLITDIHPDIRGVVQETYRMTKLTSVGLNGRYRIDIFSGGSVRRADFLHDMQRSYNPKYFPLYNSHSQKTGNGAVVEKNIDTRGNIFNGWFFKLGIPIALFGMGFAIVKVWGFFHPDAAKPKPGETTAQTQAQGSATQPATPAPAPARRHPDLSDRWRLAGYYYVRSRLTVLLVDGEGRTRVIYDPPEVRLDSQSLNVKLPEGEMATTWSGATQSARFMEQGR